MVREEQSQCTGQQEKLNLVKMTTTIQNLVENEVFLNLIQPPFYLTALET